MHDQLLKLQGNLWRNPKALAYLRGSQRGLSDETIKRKRYGYNPKTYYLRVKGFDEPIPIVAGFIIPNVNK